MRLLCVCCAVCALLLKCAGSFGRACCQREDHLHPRWLCAACTARRWQQRRYVFVCVCVLSACCALSRLADSTPLHWLALYMHLYTYSIWEYILVRMWECTYYIYIYTNILRSMYERIIHRRWKYRPHTFTSYVLLYRLCVHECYAVSRLSGSRHLHWLALHILLLYIPWDIYMYVYISRSIYI